VFRRSSGASPVCCFLPNQPTRLRLTILHTEYQSPCSENMFAEALQQMSHPTGNGSLLFRVVRINAFASTIEDPRRTLGSGTGFSLTYVKLTGNSSPTRSFTPRSNCKPGLMFMLSVASALGIKNRLELCNRVWTPLSSSLERRRLATSRLVFIIPFRVV